MSSDPVSVQVLNDFWTYFQAISTGLAALVTAITVLFIWRQTILTRRSVAATERSVKATEDALELAGKEFDRNTELLADSQRARIDSEMPRLTTVVFESPRQAWLYDESENTESHSDESELAVGTSVFLMPQDADVRIQVGIRLIVSNDGPRQARFEAYQPRNPEMLSQDMVVEAGSSKTVWVRRVETLERWVQIAKIYESDGGDATQGEDTVFEFNYIFPGDLGAIEHQRVIQGGSIVQRVAGSDRWTLAPFTTNRYGGLAAVPQPFWRDYYASRRDNRRL